MRAQAMTLVEIMLVVVILALASAALAPTLARRAAGDPLRDAAATLAAEEGHLRRVAYGHGATLRFTPQGWTGVLAAPVNQPQQGMPASRVDVPGDLTVQARAEGRALATLTLDAQGRSIDRIVEIRQGDAVRRWLVAGLTGEWMEQTVAQTP